jgi:hypothetical protein
LGPPSTRLQATTDPPLRNVHVRDACARVCARVAYAQVEGQIREIYAEMLQLQQREQEMRDLNGERAA